MNKLTLAICALCLAVQCQAYVITINLSWAINDRYNIQEGSIVQLIAYNSADSLPPPSTAIGNFEEEAAGIYNADTAPENHDIIYQTAVLNTGNKYQVFEIYELLGDYTSVYVRIFEANELNSGLSYWGIVGPKDIPKSGKVTIGANNYTLASQNYFEVIPEPSTINLVCLAVVLFIIYSLFKDARKSKP